MTINTQIMVFTTKAPVFFFFKILNESRELLLFLHLCVFFVYENFRNMFRTIVLKISCDISVNQKCKTELISHIL